ncbi:MAG: hemolysin III family protein [Myxococcota bacterium]|jgi:hemolysin III|nr:hemolysin III family protein [Myxococcota bacterium]
MSHSASSRYSPAEERANALTHLLGVILAVAALALLPTYAALDGDPWHIVSCTIYGVTQLALYSTSTIYHWVSEPERKARWRHLDHAAIFLLIAGTYTPFTLVSLRGPWGWTVFGIVWGLAVVGIGMQTLLLRTKGWVTALPYIAMGWVIVIAIEPLIEALPTGGLYFLVAGGLAYTLGAVFYAWRSLPYHHAIWHLFVMAGSGLHFGAVFFYVIPA